MLLGWGPCGDLMDAKDVPAVYEPMLRNPALGDQQWDCSTPKLIRLPPSPSSRFSVHDVLGKVEQLGRHDWCAESDGSLPPHAVRSCPGSA